MDLAKNGVVNHYLRDVDHGSHCLDECHRTVCFTYMSDQTSEVAELWGYMWGYIHLTERQRIRTVTKFTGPSAGHCERVFCSSVTRVSDFIFRVSLHNPLTITTETLYLSITGEKCTVASRQHMLTCSCCSSLPECCVLQGLMSVVSKKQEHNRIICFFSGFGPKRWGLSNPEKNWIPVFF